MGYFFSDEWVQACTKRHRTTIARWRSKRSWPPEILRLARLEIDGELGLIDPRWAGWRLCSKRGELFPPEDVAVPTVGWTPGALLATAWKLARLQALELEVEELRRTRDAAPPQVFELEEADIEAVDRLLKRLRAVPRLAAAAVGRVDPVPSAVQGSG